MISARSLIHQSFSFEQLPFWCWMHIHLSTYRHFCIQMIRTTKWRSLHVCEVSILVLWVTNSMRNRLDHHRWLHTEAKAIVFLRMWSELRFLRKRQGYETERFFDIAHSSQWPVHKVEIDRHVGLLQVHSTCGGETPSKSDDCRAKRFCRLCSAESGQAQCGTYWNWWHGIWKVSHVGRRWSWTCPATSSHRIVCVPRLWILESIHPPTQSHGYQVGDVYTLL